MDPGYKWVHFDLLQTPWGLCHSQSHKVLGALGFWAKPALQNVSSSAALGGLQASLRINYSYGLSPQKNIHLWLLVNIWIQLWEVQGPQEP